MNGIPPWGDEGRKDVYMLIPKNGFKVDGASFTLNGLWYGRITRCGRARYLKSHNCRYDNTCGGTEEISAEEFHAAAEKHAAIFRE